MRNKNFLGLSIFLSLFLIGVNIAEADQNKAALTVNPEKVSVEMQAGQKARGKLTLNNNGDLPVRLKISTKDVRLLDESGKIEFFLNDSESVSKWIIPEFLEVSLKPKSNKEISYIIYAPPGTIEKGYNGAIVFSSASADSVGAENDFGALIYINIMNGEKKTETLPKILDFSIPRIQAKSSMNLNLRVRNGAINNLVANGTVRIKNWRGKEIDKVEIKNIAMYPKSTHSFKWTWNENKPLFGFYKAEISLGLSKDNIEKVIEDSWFFSLPTRELAGWFKTYKDKLSFSSK